MTSSDVFSYFVNYVKKDLYDEGNSDSGYNVTITTKSGELLSNMSYSDALKAIGTDSYILRYKGDKNIDITLN